MLLRVEEKKNIGFHLLAIEKKETKYFAEKGELFWQSFISRELRARTMVSAWGAYFNSEFCIYLPSTGIYIIMTFSKTFFVGDIHTHSRSWHETHVANSLNEASVSNWNIRLWMREATTLIFIFRRLTHTPTLSYCMMGCSEHYNFAIFGSTGIIDRSHVLC